MAKREGVAGAPILTEAPSGCSNAVCGLVEASEPVATGKKTTYRLTVNVGEQAPLSVASTVAVDVGARIVLALAGSSIGDAEVSEATICDAEMLGWKGPSSGPGPALADLGNIRFFAIAHTSGIPAFEVVRKDAIEDVITGRRGR